ncbi:MAG: ABC transporter ATP-binding protein [Deltaproteobacteria bacterium]|jgi:iron complex transport system ATP-binding protein|nr:ABC transporter ATP-binding protein [Deltaproteobacteria bacterium]
MLLARAFSFSFNGSPALRGLDFALPQAGCLSVIGPNGAGKTTLLKCLLRLHDGGRASGEIRVKGRDLAAYGQRELARVISYVPQAGGWIPPFTVEEFLRLSRYPYGAAGPAAREDARRAASGAMSLTGTEPLAGRFLKTLSGGERQKVYLAAALAQEAELMLLDEPAAFLDPAHAAELRGLLRSLNREQGISMMTVTHNLNHPLAAGGDALVLRAGRQLFFGPVADLLPSGVLEKAYQHEFTYVQHPRTGQLTVLAD